MKYFHIKDEDGQDYMVEEVEATPVDEDTDIIPSEAQDAEPLTDEEISALKSLAAKANEILALLGTHDSEEGEEEMHDEDEEEEEVTDEEEEEEKVDDAEEEVKEEEEVIDTDKMKDSFGATVKRRKTKDSSKEAREIEIAKAWEKRYSEVK